MGVYLSLYDAVVTKITDAQGSTLSFVKQVFQGDEDRDVSNSTPCIIIVPEENQLEDWNALPNRRNARLRIKLTCIAGEDEVPTSLAAVRGALRMAELVMDALDADPQLAGTADLSSSAIVGFSNIGGGKYAWEVGLVTEKRFTAGAR